MGSGSEAATYDTGREESKGIALPILAVLARLIRGWKVVLGATLGCVLAAAAVSTAYPDRYTATTVLVQSDAGAESGLQALASRMSGDIPMLSVGRGNPNARLVGSVLDSRALEDSVKRHVERMPKRIQTTHDPKDGSIEIQITDTDPERAARIANLYPPAINSIVAGLGAQAAITKQNHLRERLAAARAPLQAAEERLTEFRRTSNAPDLQQQAIEAVETAAELQRQIARKEIEVGQLQRVVTPENPQLRAAQAELDALRTQMRRLTSGRGGEVFPSLREAPDLQIRAARLMREFMEAQQVYTALQIAVAESQLSTTNDLPVLSVLDVAVVPKKPSGPSTAVILLFAAVVGAVLGSALALVSGSMARIRATPEWRSLSNAWRNPAAQAQAARTAPTREQPLASD